MADLFSLKNRVITRATGMLGERLSLAVASLPRTDGCVTDAAARAEIVATWGTIDGLVNAAGGNLPGATVGPEPDLVDLSIAESRWAVDLNLFGTVIPTTVFGRVMATRDRGVNVSSLTAQRPLTRAMGYTVRPASLARAPLFGCG